MIRSLLLLGLWSGLLGAVLPPERASAQDSIAIPTLGESLPPAYDESLLRLAEIMGALHFLRGLCDHDDAPAWRAEMEALLAAERPGPTRRARLVARFNHGFETYHAVYRSCTPSARRAIALYLEEGESIADDVTARYGQ
jgi:uncharacterized protein (TIGR02301 family)